MCVHCTLHANSRHNLKNKPRTFIYFCCCLKELWSWISQPSRKVHQSIFYNINADQFNIFHFLCIKICHSICEMKPYSKIENFFPKENKIVHFSAAKFKYDAKAFSSFIFRFHFCLFIHVTMNTHHRRRTLDNWLFQSDF